MSKPRCWLKGDRAYFLEPANMGKVRPMIDYDEYLKIEADLEILLSFVKQVADKYYCRETGRYEDDATKILERLKTISLKSEFT